MEVQVDFYQINQEEETKIIFKYKIFKFIVIYFLQKLLL